MARPFTKSRLDREALVEALYASGFRFLVHHEVGETFTRGNDRIYVDIPGCEVYESVEVSLDFRPTEAEAALWKLEA